MKLSNIPEQDSYSYATAFVYIGAQDQKELLEKFRQSKELLKFQFRELTVPSVSLEKALEKIPDVEPDVAIQVTTAPIELPVQMSSQPAQSAGQGVIKP